MTRSCDSIAEIVHGEPRRNLWDFYVLDGFDELFRLLVERPSVRTGWYPVLLIINMIMIKQKTTTKFAKQ